MKKEVESAIQRRCQDIIKKTGAFVYKTHGDMYTRIGIPDLVACVPVTEEVIHKLLQEGYFRNNKVGIFVSFEVKTPEKINVFDDRRKAQEIVGEEIKNASGIWYAVDSNDTVEAVMELMRGNL